MSTTLLDMVQDILSALDGDEVASINDTVESLQVARCIRDSYNNLVSRVTLPEHKGFFQLASSTYGDLALELPPQVQEVDWLKYDTRSGNETLVRYRNLHRCGLEEFVNFTLSHDESNDNVFGYVYNDGVTVFQLLGINDRFAQRYTIVNDRVILFDAYWQDEEGMIDPARTLGFGTLSQTFSLSDNFVLPLDVHQIDLLYNEAKAQAFVDLKQVANPIANARARQGWIRQQRTKYVQQGNPLDRVPDYGRK